MSCHGGQSNVWYGRAASNNPADQQAQAASREFLHNDGEISPENLLSWEVSNHSR